MPVDVITALFTDCTVCSKKSDAKIEITITATNLIRIKYPLSSFNYHLSGANVANFNKIHSTVFEQQLFKKMFKIWRKATLSAVSCKSFAFYKVLW